MASVVRSVGLAAALGFAAGARLKRSESPQAKFIGKVPVLNYHKAHKGKRSTNEEEDWLIMLDETAVDSDLTALCARAPWCKMVGHPDEGGVPFLEVRGTESDLESMLGHDTKAHVKFIEPNPMEMILDLDIPELASATSREVSAASEPVWSVRRVGGDTSLTKGKGVHVYVIDSGCRTTHVDFGGRAIPTYDTSVADDEHAAGWECDGDTSCASDSIGHGTHVAGSVGGKTFGVAPESIMHIMKISFDGLSSWSRTITTLDYIAMKGQHPGVATASVGGPGTSTGLQVAIDTVTEKGIIVMTSAGNSGDDACGYTPANVPNCLSIGATSGLDTPVYFSNWGACVDIWAPGMEIISATHTSNTGSVKKAGTSMAAPHVAGGAAVLLEENPSLSPEALKKALRDRAMTDYIPTLPSEEDTNKLLFIGTGDPPPTGELELCRRRRRVLCFN